MARYQVPDNVLNALIQQESGGNHAAVSRKGARGITQIMPETARNPGYGINPLRDNSPEEAKRFTRDYLGTMVDKTGSLESGLAAYNAGLGPVLKAGGVPNIPETQNYVQKIMGSLNPISTASADETPYTPTFKEWKAMKTQGLRQAQQPQIRTPTFKEWKAAKIASEQPTEQPKTLEGFGKNVNRDLTNIGQGTIDIVKKLNPLGKAVAYATHPVDTINKDFQEVSDLVYGLPDMVKGIGNALAHPIDTAYEAPLSTAMNVAGLAGIGKNMLVGGAKRLKGRLTDNPARVAEINAANAKKETARATLKMAKKEGLAIPTSEFNPGPVRNALEGIAGKAALGQQAVIKNQPILTGMARKGLGLPKGTELNAETLDALRKDLAAPYEKVAQLDNTPSLANGYSVNTHVPTNGRADLVAWRQANNDAQAYAETAKRAGGDPEIMAKANAAKREAARLQAIFERKAAASGQPELVQQLRNARVKIAETHTVQKALNPVTGDIDPAVFGKRLAEGKPVEGEFRKIAEFNKLAPKFSKRAESVQAPGVSKVNAPVAIGLSAMVGDLPGFGVGAAAMAGPGWLRELMLSKPWQARYSKIIMQHPRQANKLIKMAASGKMTSNKLNAGLIGLANSKENN